MIILSVIVMHRMCVDNNESNNTNNSINDNDVSGPARFGHGYMCQSAHMLRISPTRDICVQS